MKNLISAEFLRRLKTTPNLKKKLKIFVGIGMMGILLAGTLAIYIGVKGVNYVADLSANLDVTQHTEALKSKVESIPTIAKTECLGTARQLLNLEKMLSTPIEDSFQTLKQACFEGSVKLPEPGKEGELI